MSGGYDGVMRWFGKDVRMRTSFVVAALALLACFAPSQTFNLYEGQGVLENNWADWSWNSNNTWASSGVPPYYKFSGAGSVEVAFTQGDAGFYLDSGNSFPAGYFTALVLQLNGGQAAGRALGVSFNVNGGNTPNISLNKFIQGGSVAANAWRQVAIPLSAFGIKPTDLISGFWLQDMSGQTEQPFYIGYIGWEPVSARGAVKVTVNAASSLRTVDQKLFGANTANWTNGLTSDTCEALLKQSGFQAFRFPGGSVADGYDWQSPTTASSPVSFDDFASVAVPLTGGQSFITVNYGSGTPDLAASWVSYSNVTKKYGMKYWEVGNECYGNWEEDNHSKPWDPVTYATAFAQYYKQMKTADPTISVGAVAVPTIEYWIGWNPNPETVTNPVTGQTQNDWTSVMLSTMAGLGVTPDFLIYHRYTEDGNECDFTLLVSNTSWVTDMANLRSELQDYLGSANKKVEIMCTENNCDAAWPEGKQMCSLVDGIFMADTFGTILQTECDSFIWFDFISGSANTGDNGSWLYGWRQYGDYGVVSTDFSQQYPTFWVEQVLNLFTKAGDEVLATTSSYGLLTAVATKRSDGTVRVMVVNKNNLQELATQFIFNGFKPEGPVTMVQYGVAQDNLAKAGKPQTIATSTIQNWETETTLSFPPYSVSVLEFPQPKAAAPPHRPITQDLGPAGATVRPTKATLARSAVRVGQR